MASSLTRSVARLGLCAVLGLTPQAARASFDVQLLPQAGSVSPDGRHVLLRLRTCHEGSGEDGAEALVLVDAATRAIRPVTHDIQASATSPDGTLVAFTTSWGVFVAAAGEQPTVGRTLEWRGFRSAIDVAWRGPGVVRVLGGYLDETLTDVDLAGGIVRRQSLRPGRMVTSLDRSGEPVAPSQGAEPSSPRRATALPTVLASASMLGWTSDGRAILGRVDRREYWLVAPETHAVDVVGEHPGAVAVDPRLELRRRVARCAHSFSTDVWLHDARPGGQPRLVFAFHGRFGGGVHADSVVTWTTEIGIDCPPS